MLLQSDVFMWNPKLETLSAAELTALQLDLLRSTVQRATANVSFYREAFSRCGLQGTQSIKTLDDIRRLPFTTKSDLRDNYPFGLLAVERSRVKRVHASSGTRGKPTVAPYTQVDLETWAQLCARSLSAVGVRAGDVLHNSYGYGLFTGGLGVHYGAEKLGATIVPASAGRTQQQIMLMQDFRARAICCTPSYALNIAMTLEECGISRDTLALQIGVLGAEPWTDECRSHIEQRLGISAYNIYGLSELLGPGIAVECTAQNGMHIWEDHFLAEIIDPASGEPVATGQVGELVLTSLTKEAQPLIRYRTGDACSFIAGTCACGRTMRRISRIQGRFDDMLIVRGVNVYPSEVEAILLAHDELSPQYQLLITRDKALDSMTVRVELRKEIEADWQREHTAEVNRRRLEEEVSTVLKQRLGLVAMVEIIAANILPRSEGKALRVLDLRQQQKLI